jgi:heptosyltransferase-2
LNLDLFKKVLIIRLSSLGDILLSTPLIRSIKRQYPKLQIDFLLRGQYKDVLVNNPYVDNIICYESDVIKKKQLERKLSEKNYELIIDLQNNFRSATISSKLNAIKVKFDKKTFEKFLLVKFKVNKLVEAGQIPLRYAETINDFQLDDEGLDLFTNNNSSTVLNTEEKYIGFCPGSRHFTKMWPEEYYIQLGNLLNEKGYHTVLLGGKSDLDVCYKISNLIAGSINLCNDDNILQTSADMQKCTAIVCNDSGLMHTACAVKVPVVTFFGSTVKEFGFTPYKNRNSILENNSLSCRPCSHIGRENCPKGHFRCMLELKPQQAFEKLILLLNSK